MERADAPHRSSYGKGRISEVHGSEGSLFNRVSRFLCRPSDNRNGVLKGNKKTLGWLT